MKQKSRDEIEEDYLEFLLKDSNELAKSLMNNYYVAYNGLDISEKDILLMDFYAHKKYFC